ncbi:agmatinase family protein [Desulfovibrio cuneatus]|uniref:agmatinase family protein n=1 Tax=Desulfovibrio cuneatus TaxID=159728 RepID=UPI0004225E01|nr:agmatinase family protein [Desulfovibrio cuneatus]
MEDTTTATRFLESELPLLPPAACRFHVIPVPYEASVSYGGGTAQGPQAILDASCQLETWTGAGEPSHQGIFTWPAVPCTGEAETVMQHIEAAVTKALQAGPQGALPKPWPHPWQQPGLQPEHGAGDGSQSTNTAPLFAVCAGAPTLPVVLGGEHSLTLGVLRAMKKAYGHFGIVHFDAHADLRHSYQGSIYSHASVMRRAVADLGLDLFQIGVRSLCIEERDFRQQAGIPHLDARVLQCPRPWGTPSQATAQPPHNEPVVRLPESFPHTVFLSFDIDALDASLMPATGTPEPGGLFWWDALNLMVQSLTGRVLLGVDVVELAPQPGQHAPNFLAARLVHEIMGMVR